MAPLPRAADRRAAGVRPAIRSARSKQDGSKHSRGRAQERLDQPPAQSQIRPARAQSDSADQARDRRQSARGLEVLAYLSRFSSRLRSAPPGSAEQLRAEDSRAAVSPLPERTRLVRFQLV